ncbi:MAG: tetratricopeptide repeat protein [Myxococcales bacterium]|nr:tetratricopeptide repeat protein [Myxococcales bacterium]
MARSARQVTARSAAWLVAFASLALLCACPPTLSRPKSAAHLDALAEGDRHARHGRHDAAAAAFATAAEAADRRVDRDEALYRRSRSLRAAARYDDAIAVLDALAAARPASRRTARALYDAAHLRFEHTGETAAALAGFERIVREHPDAGLGGRALHHWLGHVETHEGRDAAIALARRLEAPLAEASLGGELLWRLAGMLLEAERREEARATLERLVERYPYPQGGHWDDALLRLSELAQEDGDAPRAIAALEALLRRAERTTLVGSYTLPSFPEARLRLARIHRDAGDVDAARRSYERLPRDFPRSRLRATAGYELGVMLLEAGDHERGCDALRGVVEDFEVGRSRRAAAERLARDCEAARR